MHPFGVGVRGVANSFQLREYYKEASCQRRWSHGFLDCYLEMPPEFGNDPDPSGKHIQRPQSPAQVDPENTFSFVRNR